MTQVFVVTDGDYSDYYIVGVFSTKELAVKYMEEHHLTLKDDDGEYSHLEIYTLDLLFDGRKTYIIRFDSLGNIVSTHIPSYNEPERILNKIFMHKNGEAMVSVRARSEDVARKIACDLRMQYLALH